VPVLANNARPDEGGELGDGAARRVHVGKLEDRGALAGYGVLPNLADPNGCEVCRTVRVGMRHSWLSRRVSVKSAFTFGEEETFVRGNLASWVGDVWHDTERLCRGADIDTFLWDSGEVRP
jgi:hypothetical protein